MDSCNGFKGPNRTHTFFTMAEIMLPIFAIKSPNTPDKSNDERGQEELKESCQ